MRRILKKEPTRCRPLAITLDGHGSAAGFRRHVAHNVSFDDWAALSERAYLLRSNITLGRSTILESLYPTHPSRSRLPHPERSAQRPADLASAPGARSGPHIRLLPRRPTVEEPRDMAATRWPGKLSGAPCSKNLRAFNRTMSCCLIQPMARSGCAPSHNQIAHRPRSSIASALSCPNECASPNASCPPSQQPSKPCAQPKMQCQLRANPLI